MQCCRVKQHFVTHLPQPTAAMLRRRHACWPYQGLSSTHGRADVSGELWSLTAFPAVQGSEAGDAGEDGGAGAGAGARDGHHPPARRQGVAGTVAGLPENGIARAQQARRAGAGQVTRACTKQPWLSKTMCESCAGDHVLPQNMHVAVADPGNLAIRLSQVMPSLVLRMLYQQQPFCRFLLSRCHHAALRQGLGDLFGMSRCFRDAAGEQAVVTAAGGGQHRELESPPGSRRTDDSGRRREYGAAAALAAQAAWQSVTSHRLPSASEHITKAPHHAACADASEFDVCSEAGVHAANQTDASEMVGRRFALCSCSVNDAIMAPLGPADDHSCTVADAFRCYMPAISMPLHHLSFVVTYLDTTLCSSTPVERTLTQLAGASVTATH